MATPGLPATGIYVCAGAQNLAVHRDMVSIYRPQAGTARATECAPRIRHFPTAWSAREQQIIRYYRLGNVLGRGGICLCPGQWGPQR